VTDTTIVELTVDADASYTDVGEILSAIEDAGYTVEETETGEMEVRP